MKILFFINGIYLGGKERRLVELMKEIQFKPQFQFELAVMNGEINYQEIINMKIKIHYLIRKSKKDLAVFRALYSICKEFKPDIIHCWDGMTAIYSIPICKLLEIKLMNGMIVNCPSKRNILNKRLFRAKLSFPFSNVIIGNSKAGLKAYNAPLKKSIVIYNGYNFNRSKNLLDKNSIRQQLNIHTKYIIGMVATFSKSKDYDTYFKAASIVLRERNDITFLAIGNNTDSPAAKELVDQQFLDNFRFLGKKADIESFINVLDIGILATFTEGISNSIMEYMALGKPVIATLGSGTNEIVKNNETGLLVKVSDPQDLANKIEYLLNNTAIGIQMGLKGQQRIKKNFSIDSMIEKYTAVYKNILKD
jgi:glycosyltransferase involved in cell wall biosynthesis